MLKKLTTLTIATVLVTAMSSVNADNKTQEIKLESIVVNTKTQTQDGFIELTSIEMDAVTASGWPRWLRWLKGNGTNRNGIIKHRGSNTRCTIGKGC